MADRHDEIGKLTPLLGFGDAGRKKIERGQDAFAHARIDAAQDRGDARVARRLCDRLGKKRAILVDRRIVGHETPDPAADHRRIARTDRLAERAIIEEGDDVGLDQHCDNMLLRREVAIQLADRDTRVAGNLGNAGAVKPALGEQRARRSQNSVPPV
ncbi:hypothetical protein ABG067_008622, partial [Albugo candida]